MYTILYTLFIIKKKLYKIILNLYLKNKYYYNNNYYNNIYFYNNYYNYITYMIYPVE